MTSDLGMDNVYGYYPTKEKIYIATGIPPIEHEMAHLVEMENDSRIFLKDFGMKSDKGKSNSIFLVACVREIRVRAIQSHLVDKVRDPFHSFICSRPSSWKSDVSKRVPFGRFKNADEWEDWAQDLFDKTVKHWDKDRVECEWNRKAKLLNDWNKNDFI